MKPEEEQAAIDTDATEHCFQDLDREIKSLSGISSSMGQVHDFLSCVGALCQSTDRGLEDNTDNPFAPLEQNFDPRRLISLVDRCYNEVASLLHSLDVYDRRRSELANAKSDKMMKEKDNLYILQKKHKDNAKELSTLNHVLDHELPAEDYEKKAAETEDLIAKIKKDQVLLTSKIFEATAKLMQWKAKHFPEISLSEMIKDEQVWKQEEKKMKRNEVFELFESGIYDPNRSYQLYDKQSTLRRNVLRAEFKSKPCALKQFKIGTEVSDPSPCLQHPTSPSTYFFFRCCCIFSPTSLTTAHHMLCHCPSTLCQYPSDTPSPSAWCDMQAKPRLVYWNS